MTVGELKAIIADLPHNLKITVMTDLYSQSDLLEAYVGRLRRRTPIENEEEQLILEVQG